MALQRRVKRKNKKLEGDGVMDWLKNAYNVIRHPIDSLYKQPKAIKDYLEKNGNEEIDSFTICRIPLDTKTKFLTAVLTQGEFEKRSKALPYDDIYHLFCIINLKNGKRVLTERNQRVLLEDAKPSTLQKVPTDAMSINVNKKLTLNELINNATGVNSKIYRYDAISANCQDYLSTLFKGSGLMTPAIDKYINQDVSSLLNTTQKTISTATTDIASLFGNLISGGKKSDIKMLLKTIKGSGIQKNRNLIDKVLEFIGDKVVKGALSYGKMNYNRIKKSSGGNMAQQILDLTKNSKYLDYKKKPKPLKVKEIKTILKEKGIKGITGKTKPQLLLMLENNL
jgi:hypothetical protein